MKRIKNPTTNNYQITCPCGYTFNATGANATLLTDEALMQWICPSCAQIFIESMKTRITLESNE